MKALVIAPDQNSQRPPIANRSDFITFQYNETSGNQVVPTGARFAEFTATSVEGWVAFGADSSLDPVAPTTTDITDGTAPMYLPVGVPTMVALDGATHFALRCSGGVSVRWWA